MTRMFKGKGRYIIFQSPDNHFFAFDQNAILSSPSLQGVDCSTGEPIAWLIATPQQQEIAIKNKRDHEVFKVSKNDLKKIIIGVINETAAKMTWLVSQEIMRREHQQDVLRFIATP